MTDGPVERCYYILGRNIRAARRARGYTQADLAMLMRCARNTIARIEMGHERTMLHKVSRIARWLACTPHQLMRGVWR